MADFEYESFKALEQFRLELFRNNPDIAQRLTFNAPLLQTLGEVCAILGIPVELTLQQDELVKFIWDMAFILRKRGMLKITTGRAPETMIDEIEDMQADLLSEVLHELATGVIVTEDAIAVPVAPLNGGSKEIELLPETQQKIDRSKLH